jgi:hypothetical protein
VTVGRTGKPRGTDGKPTTPLAGVKIDIGVIIAGIYLFSEEIGTAT